MERHRQSGLIDGPEEEVRGSERGGGMHEEEEDRTVVASVVDKKEFVSSDLFPAHLNDKTDRYNERLLSQGFIFYYL